MEVTIASFSIEKTLIQKYKIRGKNTWADIAIDYAPGKGLIQIASDYGNWSYYWGATGSSFKKFLSQIDIHYTAGKFGADGYFDHEATISLFKKYIIDGIYDAEKRRLMFRELEELKEQEQQDMFVHHCFNCRHIMELFDGCPEVVTTIKPGFKHFWEKLWPVLLEEFKKEDYN